MSLASSAFYLAAAMGLATSASAASESATTQTEKTTFSLPTANDVMAVLPGHGPGPSAPPPPAPPVPHPQPAPVPHPGPAPGPHPGPHGPSGPVHPAPPNGHGGVVLPNRPVHHVDPPKVIQHQQPSELGNRFSRGHFDDSHRRFDDVKRYDPDHFRYANDRGNFYRDHHRDAIEQRSRIVRDFHHNEEYRFYYADWYSRGFYGGYYYPTRECDDIDVYFTYPVVYWLFEPDYDEVYWRDYYRDWNNSHSHGHPHPHPGPQPAPSQPVSAFPYAGIFYPTDTLRDLGVEVSSFDADVQYRFRQAATTFADTLQQDIADQLQAEFQLQQYDVVINHYQNLQDKALVVEGFVDHDQIHFAFKALLDLVNPDQTIVFVPNAQDPNDQGNADQLKAINDRIQQLGGDPYTADQEPETNPNGGRSSLMFKL